MKKKIIMLGVLMGIALPLFLNSNNKSEEIGVQNQKNKLLTMNLEQTAGAGDYKTVTQSEWPTEGYKFNSELSRCENGSTLNWDDDRKTVIISGNLSDKCYVYFDLLSIIEFTFMGQKYIADSNMTYEEWRDSSYNTSGYYFYSVSITNKTREEVTNQIKLKILNDDNVVLNCALEQDKCIIFQNSKVSFLDANGENIQNVRISNLLPEALNEEMTELSLIDNKFVSLNLKEFYLANTQIAKEFRPNISSLSATSIFFVENTNTDIIYPACINFPYNNVNNYSNLYAYYYAGDGNFNSLDLVSINNNLVNICFNNEQEFENVIFIFAN